MLDSLAIIIINQRLWNSQSQPLIVRSTSQTDLGAGLAESVDDISAEEAGAAEHGDHLS